MNKADRLAMYRCAIITGEIIRNGLFDVERVDAEAIEMLRAEPEYVATECDIGACGRDAERGSDLCKEHGEARS